MEGFTPDQQAKVDRLIKDSVDSAVAAAVTQALTQYARDNPRQETRTPSPSHDRSVRALTADLQPTADYYLPKLNLAIPAVEPNKVKYPRTPFSDHKGDIEYDAWKMDMKLFIQKYSGNFVTGESQVHAYFECTKGEAKTIILQRMDPDFAGDFNSAADVLKALDQRFFDHNRVQVARLKYSQLLMGNMTYNEFRTKFTTYATTGKISPSRWFDDVCEKVSDELKYDIRTKKYEFGGDYTALDEFLAVSDRELRNIAAGRAAATRKPPPSVSFNTSATDSRGILKKDNWRSTSPTPQSANGARYRSPSPAAHPVTPHPRPATPGVPPAGTTCLECKSPDHWVADCPVARKQKELSRKIAAVSIEDDLSSDELSKNY